MARTKAAQAQAAPEPRNGTDKYTSVIPAIFQQTQVSLANHRKNIVALSKSFSGCAGVCEEVNGGLRLTGEKAFQTTFAKMVNNVLPVKKGVSNADKVVKFIGAFVKYITDKAASQKEEVKKEEDKQDEEDSEEDDDTPASRFVTYLLRYLLQGFMAKDKNVRYRSVHITAEMISGLGEIDDDIYEDLRSSLLERARDKETFVRLQAAIALAKLQRGENEQEEDREIYLSDVLIDMLQHDPAPEVRRAALLNLAPSQKSLTVILSRTRDVDTTLRKIVYHHVLSNLKPQLLSLAQREEIVSNGLGDREPSVRGAAARMIGTWVDAKEGDLIEFLKSFDLLKSKVAEDALLSVFVTRADVFDAVSFKGMFKAYWNNLTPERVFLARVYIEHCISKKLTDEIEAALPVVTLLAFRIQEAYNKLLQLLTQLDEIQNRGEDAEEKEDDKTDTQLEEAVIDAELVVGELLGLAVHLDYGDEIGRRKMFVLVRDMLSQEALPEKLVNKALDVLAMLAQNERDLIRIVVEIVTELRDVLIKETEPPTEGTQADDRTTQWGDDERTQAGHPKVAEHELTPEEVELKLAIDLRSVTLCVGMLERTLQENSALHGLVPDLIIPSIQSKEPQLRERGLICLGLCCLIDKRMAMGSYQLFVNQVQTAGIELKRKVLPILYDLIMVHHDAEYLREDRLVHFLLHQLQDDDEEIQATTCVGFSKLLLAGVITDERVLKSLVAAYIQPDTADNQPLRQCLSYFFPVFCYSSSANQRTMQKIFMAVFKVLSDVYREKDEDQEMVTPAQFGALLIDWTDPAKVVEVQGQERDESIHVDVACDIIRELFEKEMDKEDRKILVQMLGKLHLPDKLGDMKILSLHLLITNLRRCRPLRDAPTRNAFKKFNNAFRKKYTQQLSGLTQAEHETFGDLHIQELQQWINGVDPDSDAEEIDPPEDEKPVIDAKRGGKARRAKTAGAEAAEDMKQRQREVDDVLKEEQESQVAPSDGEEDEVEEAPPVDPGEDEEEEEEEEEEE